MGPLSDTEMLEEGLVNSGEATGLLKAAPWRKQHDAPIRTKTIAIAIATMLKATQLLCTANNYSHKTQLQKFSALAFPSTYYWFRR